METHLQHEFIGIIFQKKLFAAHKNIYGQSWTKLTLYCSIVDNKYGTEGVLYKGYSHAYIVT